MSDLQNHIHLIGNPDENFYILGKRDKEAFAAVYNQISSLCARNNVLAKVIKIAAELVQNINSNYPPSSIKHLKSYAEGLERPFEDIMFSLLLPEIVSSFNKWIPNLMAVIPGCSSLFIWDEKNQGVIHSRILDYALSGPFESGERSVLYDFKGEQKIYSLATAGMPLASLSAMNESGLTLALHHKHGNYFNMDGESIFLITNELLKKCKNIHEAIKFLKRKKSISYWGIYMSDRAGNIACVDICGADLYQMKYDIRDHDYLYFNNRPILKKNHHQGIRPYGNLSQCLMRRKSVEAKLKKINLKDSSDLMLTSLEVLGMPSPKKADSALKWSQDTITSSSIQMYALHNSQNESYFVPGIGPKFLQDKIVCAKNIFKRIKKSEIDLKVSIKPEFIKGYQRIAKYQTAIDTGNSPDAYHEIQMAMEYFKGYPEEIITRFFWLITEYVYESDKRDISFLFNEFRELEGLLPEYLEDHRLLFILRCGKLLNHEIDNHTKYIKNKNLRKIYRDEFKLKPLAIRGLKFLIFPRIEILDVIYAY